MSTNRPLFKAFLVIELNIDTYLGVNNFPTQNSVNHVHFPVITHLFCPEMIPKSLQGSNNANINNTTKSTSTLEPMITPATLALANPQLNTATANLLEIQRQASNTLNYTYSTTPLTPTQALEQLPTNIAQLAFPDYSLVNSGFSSSFDATLEYNFSFVHNGELCYGFCRRFLHVDQDIAYPTVHCIIGSDFLPRFWMSILEITHVRATINPNALFAFLHALVYSSPSSSTGATTTTSTSMPTTTMASTTTTTMASSPLSSTTTLSHASSSLPSNNTGIISSSNLLENYEGNPHEIPTPTNTNRPHLSFQQNHIDPEIAYAPTTLELKVDPYQSLQQSIAYSDYLSHTDEEQTRVFRQWLFTDASFMDFVFSHSLPFEQPQIQYTIPYSHPTFYPLFENAITPNTIATSLAALLVHVSVETFIQIFMVLFFESPRILFVSQNLLTPQLMQCVQGFHQLLQPFAWNYTFLPLLPASLVHQVINSNNDPFICGVTRDVLDTIISSKPSSQELVVVDLDGDRVVLRVGGVVFDAQDSTFKLPLILREKVDRELKKVKNRLNSYLGVSTKETTKLATNNATSNLSGGSSSSSGNTVNLTLIPLNVLQETSLALTIISQSIFITLLSIIQWDKLWLQEHLHVLSRPVITGELVLPTIDGKIVELIPLVHSLVNTRYFRTWAILHSPLKDRLNDPTRSLSPGPHIKKPPFDKVMADLLEVKSWPSIASYTTTIKRLTNYFTPIQNPEQPNGVLSAHTKALTMAFTANDSEPCILPEQPHPLLLGPDIGLCTSERYQVKKKKSVYHFITDCSSFEPISLEVDAKMTPITTTNSTTATTTTTGGRQFEPSRFTSTLQLLKDRMHIVTKTQPLISLSYDPRTISVILSILERRFEDRESQRQWKHALHSLLLLDVLLQSGGEFIFTRLSKSMRGHIDEFIRYIHKEKSVETMVRNQAIRVKEHLTTRWALSGTRIYRESILQLFFRVMDPSVTPFLNKIHKLSKYKQLVVTSPLDFVYPIPQLFVDALPSELQMVYSENQSLEKNLSEQPTNNQSGEAIWAELRIAQTKYSNHRLKSGHNLPGTGTDSEIQPFSFSQVFDATITRPICQARATAKTGGSTAPIPAQSLLQQKSQFFSLIPQFNSLSSIFDDDTGDFGMTPTPISQQYIDSIASRSGYVSRIASTNIAPIYITQQPPLDSYSDDEGGFDDGNINEGGEVEDITTSSSTTHHHNEKPVIRFFITKANAVDNDDTVYDQGHSPAAVLKLDQPAPLPVTPMKNIAKMASKFGSPISNHITPSVPLPPLVIKPPEGHSKYLIGTPLKSPAHKPTFNSSFLQYPSSPSVVLLDYDTNKGLFDLLCQDLDVTTYLDDSLNAHDETDDFKDLDHIDPQHSLINPTTPVKSTTAAAAPGQTPVPPIPTTPLRFPHKPAVHIPTPVVTSLADEIVYQDPPPLLACQPNEQAPPQIPPEQVLSFINLKLNGQCTPWQTPMVTVQPPIATIPGSNNNNNDIPTTPGGAAASITSLSPFQTVIPRMLGRGKEKVDEGNAEGGSHIIPLTPVVAKKTGNTNNNNNTQESSDYDDDVEYMQTAYSNLQSLRVQAAAQNVAIDQPTMMMTRPARSSVVSRRDDVPLPPVSLQGGSLYEDEEDNYDDDDDNEDESSQPTLPQVIEDDGFNPDLEISFSNNPMRSHTISTNNPLYTGNTPNAPLELSIGVTVDDQLQQPLSPRKAATRHSIVVETMDFWDVPAATRQRSTANHSRNVGHGSVLQNSDMIPEEE